MPDTHDERGGDETPLARVQAFQRAANPNGDCHWPAEEAANVGGVPLYFDDIESLSAADNFDVVEAVVARWRKTEEQLAAATARAEKAEALVAEANERADKFCGAFSDAGSLAYRRGKLLDEAITRQAELAKERDEARELACASLDILRNVSDEPMRELFEVDDMDEMPSWFTRYGKPSGVVVADASPDGRSEPVERSEASGGHGEGSNSRATTAGLSEPEGGCPWCGTLQKLDADGLISLHRLPNDLLCPGGTRRPNDDTTEDGQHG